MLRPIHSDFDSSYTRMFDSGRANLGTAYAKDALFSCRVHHLQQPSLSMAGLFAPESKALLKSSRQCSKIALTHV